MPVTIVWELFDRKYGREREKKKEIENRWWGQKE